MNSIYLVPVGGLANRFRAVASAALIAAGAGSQLEVYWFTDWALNAPFHAFFQPVSVDGVRVHEASFLHRWLIDRPRKKNFFLPRIFQRLRFKTCVYENEVATLREQPGYFIDKALEGDMYIASFNPMVTYPSALLRSLFRPLPALQQEIEIRRESLKGYCIGVHVRRTDHVTSIANSPDELFFEAIDQELAAHGEVTIYLATDSEDVKQHFKQHYGKNVHYSAAEADRNSVAGIREAIVEMFVLSRMQKIYGSFGSSFSELAAQLGDIPLIVLKK